MHWHLPLPHPPTHAAPRDESQPRKAQVPPVCVSQVGWYNSVSAGTHLPPWAQVPAWHWHVPSPHPPTHTAWREGLQPRKAQVPPVFASQVAASTEANSLSPETQATRSTSK